MVTKTASDYIPVIKSRYASLKQDPTNKAKKKLLRDTVKRWAAKNEAEVLAASNEGKGYQRTPDEIGYPVRPMPVYHPKKWPYHQFGDYQACIPGLGWYGVVIERKTLQDAVSTIIEDDHRENLYEEIGRFHADPRFKDHGIFRMDFECTEEQFFDFLPPYPKTCKFCTCERVQLDSGDLFCQTAVLIFDTEIPDPKFRCHNGFQEYQRSEKQIETIRKKKESVLRTLRAMGVQLCWRGSREAANEAYKPDLEAWCVENYVRLLKLEEYDDYTMLMRKKAYYEAELQTLADSLSSYDKVVEEMIA
jgi:hypothetical protein